MRWTEAKLIELKRRLNNKIPVAELATMYGISRARLYQVIQQHGLETPKLRNRQKQLTPEQYRVWKNLIAIKHRTDKEFTVTVDDLLPLPTHCPAMGIKLRYDNITQLDDSPSIDRIDNNLGYTPDNVVIVSHKANRAKNNCTVEELQSLVNYLNSVKV